MDKCKVSKILAYLALIYILTSIIYLLITIKYGTPFKDAIENYPELKKIKELSVYNRKNAFYTGLVISCIVLFILQPFKTC